MRASWDATYRSLSGILNRKASEDQFRALRQRHGSLSPFALPGELVIHQHAAGGGEPDRHVIVRDLLAAAQSNLPGRDLAQVLLLLSLWPALDAIRGRLMRDFPNGRFDHGGDVLAEFADQVARLDLARVDRVTGTLVRNTERDLRRRRVAERKRDQLRRPIDESVIDDSATARVQSLDEDDDRLILLATLPAQDFALLQRVLILGETQAQAGLALGLGPAAARKRYQRAIALLRKKSLRPLSHSTLAVGLSPVTDIETVRNGG